MALANPNVQQRNQYGKDWGTHASLLVCPNASAWAGGANPAAPLEAGDYAFVTGIGSVYCVSAGTVGGLDAVWARIGAQYEYEGFQTADLADYYVVPPASGGLVCPGADDFIFIAMVTPFAVRNGALNNFIAQNAGAAGGAARGWRLHWSAGVNLEATVYVTGPAALQAVSGTTAYSSSFGKIGHMHPVAIRVYQSVGPQTTVECWFGPAMVAQAVGAAGVLPANNAADQMRIGSGVLFGGEASLDGGCYGAAYYEGTRTDDEMRSLMGRCYTELRIPNDVAWTNRWQGADVVTAPATWPATDGGVALDRAGAPAGSAAYFPPA